jgi:hypothetical protein
MPGIPKIRVEFPEMVALSTKFAFSKGATFPPHATAKRVIKIASRTPVNNRADLRGEHKAYLIYEHNLI